jgi:hypothetical protein
MSLLLLFNQTSAWRHPISDSFTLVDSDTNSNTKTISDSISFTDIFASLSVFYRTLSDSLGLSDQWANTFTKALADSITTGDNTPLQFAVIKAISDSFSLSEQFNRHATFSKSISDTITLNEQTSKGLIKPLIDSISLGESLSRQWTILRAIADTLNVSDSLPSKRTGKALADVITMTDVMWRIYRVSDSLIFSDETSKSIGAKKDEIILFTGPDGNRLKRWTGSEWKAVDILTVFKNLN